jgi:hypothetical protein
MSPLSQSEKAALADAFGIEPDPKYRRWYIVLWGHVSYIIYNMKEWIKRQFSN